MKAGIMRGDLGRALGMAVGLCLCSWSAGQAVHQGGQVFEQRIPGTTIEFKMVKVDGGTLQIPADDGGVQRVEVGDLWFSQTEVTWDLYDVWVYELDQSADEDVDGVSRPSKPYIPPDRGFGHSGHPAISMSRHASVEFCRWLSEKTDRRYRLPTREEWTHAALGGA